MTRSYVKGFSSALLNWRFVLLVFALGLLGGCAFMACSWLWLASALDSSLATRTLLTSLDINVFIDLATYHGAGLAMLLMVAVILAAGGCLLWIWVNAAVVAAVSGVHDSMAAACRAGATNYLELLKLWAGALMSYMAIGAAAYLVGRVLTRWTADSSSELTPYWIIGGCVFVALAAALVIATIHDHARIRCLGTSETGGRAGLWACAYVLRERKAVALTMLLGCTSLAVWAIYQLGATALPANSGLGLAVSLVWAQAFMAVRAILRVWAFAAATELQSSADAM